MTQPRTRKPVALPDWKPVARDLRIGYHYFIPSSGRPARHSDRWMRIPYQIASAALHTGATEFTVTGGVGTRAWVRTVTCTEEQADAWFREKIALPGGFQLKGEYRKALGGQTRRRERVSS